MIRKANTLLACTFARPIIPESHSTFRSTEKKGLPWTNLKRWQAVEEELARLRKFVDEEVAPATERRTAQVLAKLPKTFRSRPKTGSAGCGPGLANLDPTPNREFGPPPLLSPALYFDPVAAGLRRKAPYC